MQRLPRDILELICDILGTAFLYEFAHTSHCMASAAKYYTRARKEGLTIGTLIEIHGAAHGIPQRGALCYWWRNMRGRIPVDHSMINDIAILADIQQGQREAHMRAEGICVRSGQSQAAPIRLHLRAGCDEICQISTLQWVRLLELVRRRIRDKPSRYASQTLARVERLLTTTMEMAESMLVQHVAHWAAQKGYICAFRACARLPTRQYIELMRKQNERDYAILRKWLPELEPFRWHTDLFLAFHACMFARVFAARQRSLHELYEHYHD